jgi:hypothetical protein
LALEGEEAMPDAPQGLGPLRPRGDPPRPTEIPGVHQGPDRQVETRRGRLRARQRLPQVGRRRLGERGLRADRRAVEPRQLRLRGQVESRRSVSSIARTAASLAFKAAARSPAATRARARSHHRQAALDGLTAGRRPGEGRREQQQDARRHSRAAR